MNKYVLFAGILLAVFFSNIVLADEPGDWQRHFKESISSFSGALDSKLSERIKTTKDLVMEKGCKDKQDTGCEKLRSDYLDAVANYLINAKEKVDKAIKSGDLAYSGSRRSGMRVKSIKAMLSEVKKDSNEITKIQFLNEMAMGYDPSIPLLLTDDMLISLHETEIGLNNDILRLDDDHSITLERWLFALKRISKEIALRSKIIGMRATEGTIRATAISLCLSAKKPLSECSNIAPGMVISSAIEPLKDMSDIFSGKGKESYSPPHEQVDKAREYYKNYR